MFQGTLTQKFKSYAAAYLMPLSFWDVKRHIIVIIRRRFGTTYRSHFQ